MGDLERFGVSMDAKLLSAFDALTRRQGYTNRSEAIRDLVRDRLARQEWLDSAQEVVGVVTLVYDHHVRELTAALIDLQHDCEAEVICSTHVHLDHHNCLEIIALRGAASVVQAVADRLIGTRGVKHGQLMRTTTGERLV